MRAKPAALLVIFVLCAGCNKTEKDRLRDSADEFDQIADVLAQIMDRQSYEKAKQELKRLRAAQRQSFREADNRYWEGSVEERAKVKRERDDAVLGPGNRFTPEATKYLAAKKRYEAEIARIADRLPEVYRLLSDEILRE